MSLVPIIIPFYKEHEKLAKCRAAIAAQSHVPCEVFIRDNSDDNILFTAAVNEGLDKYCWQPGISYVMVLNQDAYMEPHCIGNLVRFMDANPECGIACPLQVAQARKSMTWGGAGTALQVSGGKRVTWGGSLQAFPMGHHRCDTFASYVQPSETFWANGACMLIRTRVVKEVGLFDKNMRFICSDSDFSFSARSRGWKVFVVPDALVEHGLGASASASNPEINLVKVKDALYFAQKWLSGDLYRSLAFEGSGLTRTGVKMEVEKLQRMVAQLEDQKHGRLTAQAIRLPRWAAPLEPASGR